MTTQTQHTQGPWHYDLETKDSRPMTITIEIRNVYGNATIYPVCNLARQFATLLGQKTITGDQLRQIRAMGILVTIKQQELRDAHADLLGIPPEPKTRGQQ